MLQGRTAVKLAGAWHDGHLSALYSFASTGEYYIEYHLWYLKEVEMSLHSGEYALHPHELSKKDTKALTELKEWFVKEGEYNGLKTEWIKNEQYGYMMPRLAEDTPKELREQVEAPMYLK